MHALAIPRAQPRGDARPRSCDISSEYSAVAANDSHRVQPTTVLLDAARINCQSMVIVKGISWGLKINRLIRRLSGWLLVELVASLCAFFGCTPVAIVRQPPRQIERNDT